MVRIDKNSAVSINNQILEQIKTLIFMGVLKSGDKLPSVRTLSSDLVLNPNTVQKAYKELELLGFIETKAGKGAYVKELKQADIEEFKNKMIKNFEHEVKKLLEIGFNREEIKKIVEEV